MRWCQHIRHLSCVDVVINGLYDGSHTFGGLKGKIRKVVENASDDTGLGMRTCYTEDVGRRSDGDSSSPRSITRGTHPGRTTSAISRLGLPVEPEGGEKREGAKASALRKTQSSPHSPSCINQLELDHQPRLNSSI